MSGASSLRLESYLFTEQGVAAARDHLAPGGAFSMYNFYREQWLVDRLAGTLDTVFGHPPCVYQQANTSSLAVMTVGLTPADQFCAQPWVRPASVVPPAARAVLSRFDAHSQHYELLQRHVPIATES